jgi:hypothetical protein
MLLAGGKVLEWNGVPTTQWNSGFLTPAANTTGDSVNQDPGDPGGGCDLVGVSLLRLGMLLYVGCLFAKAYPQDF